MRLSVRPNEYLFDEIATIRVERISAVRTTGAVIGGYILYVMVGNRDIIEPMKKSGDLPLKKILKKFIKIYISSLLYEERNAIRNVDAFDAQQQLINGLGKSDILIFDVGANKGQTAEKYRQRFQNAEIYCFEPFPDSLNALRRKFSDDAKTHIVAKAVSNKPGRELFYINGKDMTNSLLPRPTSARRYYPKKAGPKDTIYIEVTTLDKVVSDNKIAAVDILKMDIQGAELMALQGAKNLLQTSTSHPMLIYTEIMFTPHYEKSPLFHDLWSFLISFGYSLFSIYNISTATNGQIRQGDAIFVSEILRQTVIDRYPDEP